ncbi:MAG TPA: glycosyltransferase [Xanthobacteraceae bacterium]|nr:glycosyltransferase [Xanthobacteraceae bacterium]
MRILLSTDPFLPVPPPLYGGVERIVAALLADLRRRGHEVGLIAHADSSAAVDFFVAWPDAPPESAAAHIRNMRALLTAVSRFQPSIVHSFSRLLYLAPLLPRRIPKIMSYQRFVGGRQISLAALVGGSSLMFTGCSKFIATMGGKYGGAWRAIPNFVDTDFYDFKSRVPDDAPLVFLSRVEREKGAHWAIEIAKNTGRRLLIAGNYADAGHQRQYWDHMIRPELGNNGIEYVGAVGDEVKRQLLGSAAAMVVPIQWDEPFGIVFAEALACGTPVITCPRGAAPEIVRDGIDGFLIQDVSEGCRAVHRLGTIDRRKCRERAVQAFSVAAVVPQYEALYKELLQRT